MGVVCACDYFGLLGNVVSCVALVLIMLVDCVEYITLFAG